LTERAGASAAAPAAAAAHEDDFTGALGDEMMAGDDDLELEDVGGLGGDPDEDL
jgi:hypothetical protein